jgi:hypothetical protein
MAHILRLEKGMKTLGDFTFLLVSLATASIACGGSTADGTSSSGGSSGGSSGASSSSSTSSSSGGTSGSSSGSTSGGLNPEGYESVCTGNAYAPLSGLKIDPSVDYVELRYVLETGGGPSTQPPTSAAKDGSPCATATNKPTCEKALADHKTSEGWIVAGQISTRNYLVHTRGDIVADTISLDAVRTLVAPIDSIKDAALVATLGKKYYIDCTKPGHVKKTTTGYEVLARSGSGCGQGDSINEHRLAVAATDGVTTELETKLVKEGDPNCAIGRMPKGLVAAASSSSLSSSSFSSSSSKNCGEAGESGESRRGRAAVADHFAKIARLEAASVFAFDRLADELDALNAPSELVTMAKESAREEEHHAELMAHLARRFGYEGTIRAEINGCEMRSLFAIAMENAIEGCVRETYGALVATHQSLTAEDAEVRASLKTIAEDETRHAWFSLRLHEWAKTQVTTEEALALEQARRSAMRDLKEAIDAESVSEEVARLTGHPTRSRARDLAKSLFAAIS